MKIKTSELTGAALDWAVAQLEGITEFGAPPQRSQALEFAIMHPDDPDLQFSTDWSQGGPIIDREKISVWTTDGSTWHARDFVLVHLVLDGPTPLIAAMRCFVASRLGGEVDVPDELLTP